MPRAAFESKQLCRRQKFINAVKHIEIDNARVGKAALFRQPREFARRIAVGIV